MIPAVAAPEQEGNAEERAAAAGASDEAIVADMMTFMQSAVTNESDNRLNMVDDLEFITGAHWPANEARARSVDQRPTLTINKLPNFLHQVTNDQRLNRPQIKVFPVDSNADVETAKVIQGIVKYIEYNSNSDVAEDRAVNSAAAVGLGYMRLVTDYASETSFDQDIYFKSIRNTFSVYWDPMSTEPDGSDATECAISCDVTRKAFEKAYPDAKAVSASSMPVKGTGDKGILWIGANLVRIVEYYRIERAKATLCLYFDGSTGWKDDPANAIKGDPVRERQSYRRKVMWYKCTAFDVLERAEIPCYWIPVFPVYGDEFDIDGRVYRSGIIRWAKDPSRIYDYWMSAATEQVALIPKAPYIGAVGQFEDLEEKWKYANIRSYSTLEYNPVEVNGVLVPPPQRQPMADVPIGAITLAMHASDDIKATTGLFDSSLGARGTATSGVQERQQQAQGDVANYHYQDNLIRTKRHVGRCILSMIPRVYDAERVVRIMGEDDSIEFATVNQVQQTGVNEQGQAIYRVLNDLTVEKYDVTIASGPSYSTMREESAEAMTELGRAWPKLMDIAGDIVVKTMNWPGAQQISDRIKKGIPANLTQEEDKDAPQVPPQLLMQLQKADQIIQMQQQRIKELESGQAADMAKAELDANTKLKVAEQNNETKIIVEGMKQLAPMNELRTRIDGVEAALGDVAGVLIPPESPERNEP